MHEFESLTAPALRALIESGVSTAVIPFGSIEHQGGHLPVGADAFAADWVGREVARRLEALLLPTVRVGDAAAHASLDGTLTLRTQAVADLAVELGMSLARHGVRTIALVSTHGGNAAALDAAVGRLSGLPGDAIACAPRGDVGPAPGPHSGEWLTSVMLMLRPDLVVLPAELASASAARGAEHLERFVAAVVREVRAGR